MNASSGAANRVVFLDRDGTINQEVDFLREPEQVVLLKNADMAIRRLNEAGYLAIVITNQPVVAMGLCTEEKLAHIHARLRELLAWEGASLDAIYHCPHDPDARGVHGVASLQIDCDCRKPKVGLIRRAQADFHLDLHGAWLVGDKTTDIRTAHDAGIRSILVQTGYAGADRKYADEADYNCPSLSEAVDLILELDRVRDR